MDDNDLIEIEEEEGGEQFNIEEQSEDVAKYGKKKESAPSRQKFDSAEYMMKKQKDSDKKQDIQVYNL